MNNDNIKNNNIFFDIESSGEVIPIFQKDYEDLHNWVSLERTNDHTSYKMQFSSNLCGFTYYLDGHEWWDFHKEIGGFEHISFKIQNIIMDINHDGKIDEKELEETKENRIKTIEYCLSQMLNYSVVGGLAVSVLYAVSLNPLNPSDTTRYYLSQNTIYCFYYIYYSLLYYGLMQSFMLIYKASRCYLHLSIWMPTLNMKHWYISQFSLVPLIFTTNRIIKSIALSIPFGVTVSISPGAGIVAVVFLLLFFIENIKMSKMDVFIGTKIFDFTKKIIDEKEKEKINRELTSLPV